MTPPSPTRVLHIASHNINVGDGALISSIQRRLRAITATDIAYDEVDIVDFEPEFGGLKLDTIDFSPYALALVGGGGTIDSKKSRTISGMAFPMSGKRLRSLQTPLAYVGLGYNLFWGQPLRGREALREVLKVCQDQDIPFSVRNDSSLERLREAMGDTASSVIEIPDPGFFIEVDRSYTPPQFTARRPRILLQLAADNDAQRFSLLRNDFLDRVANRLPFEKGHNLSTEIARLVVWLVKEHDAQVIFAPHITTDLSLVANVLQQLPVTVARKNTTVLGIPHPQNAHLFFSTYAQADLVIGMRGHSVICAVGLDVPCIALSTHPKVSGFMEKCGLGAWVVDYNLQFEEHLRDLTRKLLTNPQPYHSARATGTANFATRFDDFLRLCWSKVSLP